MFIQVYSILFGVRRWNLIIDNLQWEQTTFMYVIRTRSTGLPLKNSAILASLTFTSVRPVYFLRQRKFVCGEVVQRWQNAAPLQLQFLNRNVQRTKEEKSVIYYCRFGDKIMLTEGRKINAWNGKEKHRILSTPLAVNLNRLGWKTEERALPLQNLYSFRRITRKPSNMYLNWKEIYIR